MHATNRQTRVPTAVALALLLAPLAGFSSGHAGLSSGHATFTSGHPASQEGVRVVASLTPYRAIAEEIVGDKGTVESIAAARQDAHFVQARPSYSIMLSRADLLIATGLDLEMWMPAVIDKSRNPRIREGEIGYVSVSTGAPMLQVPENASRAGGDIHLFGNPHIHTDPVRAIIVADNIKTGLQNVDPGNAAYYQQRFDAFKEKIHDRLFGAALVEMVGGDRLADLALRGRLRALLEGTEIGGAPLLDRQGGWLAQAECARGKRIVAYHLNWIYFTDRFGIEIADYVERRPGIPPSASHAASLIELIRGGDISVLWVADYFDERTPRMIAERTGAKFLYVPLYTDPDNEDLDEYTELVDAWIASLKSAIPGC